MKDKKLQQRKDNHKIQSLSDFLAPEAKLLNESFSEFYKKSIEKYID